MTVSIVVAGLCVVLFGAVALYVRMKFRLAWRKIHQLELQQTLLEKNLLELDKAHAIAGITDFRLRPLMPSQHGEDLVLARYFGFRREGVFIEVGANDPVNLSNSYFFESIGWHGILIEPNPVFMRRYLKQRPHSEHVQAAVANGDDPEIELQIVEGADELSYSFASDDHLNRVQQLGAVVNTARVPCRGLSEIIDDSLLEPEAGIDFISVDVEGAELTVLQSLDMNRHRPEVFVVEDNSAGKDASVSDYLAQFGYMERLRVGCNVLYLHRDNDRVLRYPGPVD